MWCPLARRTANLVSVRLHAFEALDAIVKDRGSGGDAEVPVGLDDRVGPARRFVPIHFQHVVCHGHAELQVFEGRLVLRAGGEVDLNLGSVDIAGEGGACDAPCEARAAKGGASEASECKSVHLLKKTVISMLKQEISTR